MGIEPTFSAWEADVLPLNYTRTGIFILTWMHSMDRINNVFATCFATEHTEEL